MRPTPRLFVISLALGAVALGLNTVILICFGSTLIPLGNLAFYLAAGSIGLPATCLSLAVGLMPMMLVGGFYLEALRVVALCFLISVIAGRYPRLPQFVVTFGAWGALFWPAYLVFGTPSYPGQIPLIFLGISEVFFSMVVGLMFMSRTIWTSLTNRPRHDMPSSWLLHANCALVAGSFLFATLVMSGIISSGSWYSPPGATGLLLCAFVLCLISAGTVTMMLLNFEERVLPKALPFSGESAEFWRRKSSIEIFSPRLTSSDIRMTSEFQLTGSDLQVPSLLVPELGILALKHDGMVSFINRRFRQLSEASDTGAVGKQLSDLAMNAAIKSALISLFDDCRKINKSRLSEVKCQDLPELRFLEVSCQPSELLPNSSIAPGPGGVVITLRDITDRRVIEQQLLENQKHHALGALVGGLVHTVSNTLTSIATHAGQAAMESENERSQVALQNILDQVHETGALLQQLAGFAAPASQRMERREFCTVVEQQLKLLKPVVGERTEILFSPPGQYPMVLCDPTLIAQALTNLVQNAKDAYQDEGGIVDISLSTEDLDEQMCRLSLGAKPGRYVRLRVRDHGVGMSTDILARAFDPLFTTKEGSQHRGLGLSTVYAITRAHDGFLTCESKPGKGTTVSLYFPLQELRVLQDDRARQGNGVGEYKRGKDENILVVEDDSNIREVVAGMLRNLGYRVSCCENGVQALESCRGSTFDLLLVDMVMPKMHGLDLLEALKNENLSVKTVLMTGYGVQDHPSDARVLQKPFDLAILSSTIREELERDQKELLMKAGETADSLQ